MRFGFKHFFFSFRLVLWPLVFYSCSGVATQYELRKGNTDIIYLLNARVDYALRNYLADQAQHSIDVVTLSQVPDEVGLPWLHTLRNAANRRVKVRYLYEGFTSQFEGDLYLSSKSLLADSALAEPPQVIATTAEWKKNRGFASDDVVHEKIVIIDRGTPNEMIIFGGRNFTRFSLNTYDSAYIIRPIDHQKPYIGTDISSSYDKLWEFFKTEIGTTPIRPLGTYERSLAGDTVPFGLQTHLQKKEFRQLRRLLAKLPTPTDSLLPFQFRPRSAQLVTNDLFPKLIIHNPGNSLDQRATMQNDVLDFMIPKIDAVSRVDQSSFAISLPPPLRAAYERLLARGGQLDLMTNGRGAHNSVFINRTPIWAMARLLHFNGMAADHSLVNTMELLESVNRTTPDAKLKVFLRDSNRVRKLKTDERKEAFSHRKLMLLGNKYTVTGSENFTQASYGRASEMAILFEDPRLVHFMRNILGERERALSEEFRSVETMRKHHAGRNILYRFCKEVMRRLY